MSSVLDDAAVRAALDALPGWSGDTRALTRSYEAPDFMSGIRLVESVAHEAEDMGHHPDIDVRWTTVTFRLSSHSAGGVTEKDLELARRIDDAANRHDAR